MSINHGWHSGAVAAFLCLVLAGCASPQPDSANPAGEPSPTPSAEVPAEVATLRFAGSGLQALDAEGSVLDDVAFADGAEPVVDFLSESLDAEPSVVDNAAACAAAHTAYEWPGVSLAAWTGSTAFVATVSAAASGDVRLETTGGFAPGDDVSAFVATLPADRIGRTPAADLFVAFDVVSTTTDGAYTSPVGAVGYLPDGAILQTVITPGEWSSFLC